MSCLPVSSRSSRSVYAPQRGASLIIALVLLSLLALLVIGSFNLSSSNLQAVNNMQRRDEALAAADQLLEESIAVQLKVVNGSLIPPVVNTKNINGFTVTVEKPKCIEVVSTTSGSPVSVGTSVTLGPGFSASESYDTLWEFKATVQEGSTGFGTKVVVVQGVRVILGATDKATYCP